MDEQSLYTLDQDTLLIVPTGSLATHLNEVVAQQHIQQGAQVWEAPSIFGWTELLRNTWQLNREKFAGLNAVLGAQQAKLLWTQVIEKSKHASHELTLLNVPQTVKAAMRSDRLLSDWRCKEVALQDDHIDDVSQFLAWRQTYHGYLEQRGLIDEPLLQSKLLELATSGTLTFAAKRVVWYAYDLITAAQQDFNQALQSQQVSVEFGGPKTSRNASVYQRFESDAQELEQVLRQARARLEDNPEQRINIVVPDLQHRYAQVQELARQTFYPNASLTDAQNNHSVYRLSLGKAMHEWPAVEAALCALRLLKSRISRADFAFLCRSVYLGESHRHRVELTLFERWLRRRRIRAISVERLPSLLSDFYQALEERPGKQEQEILDDPGLANWLGEITAFYRDLHEQLAQQKQRVGFSALSFSVWAEIIDGWLALWQWQTNRVGTEFSSVAHQLRRRWVNVLEEFAGLGAVQRNVGLSKAMGSFEQLVRDSVFLPQSAMSPLVISGLFEALGRETDMCYLTGMTQDFPPAVKTDAFIPNHHLVPTGYPDASPQTSLAQAKKVIQSLLCAAANAQVSFGLESSTNADLQNQASPLFASGFAQNLESKPTQGETKVQCKSAALEAFIDTQGPGWHAPEKARGGAAIFKNQSLCPFKAFVTHQLRFEPEDEPEFGLDHLDRGNLTHKMLELVWARLPDQTALQAMDEAQQLEFLQQTFAQLLSVSSGQLPEDKLRLLALEKTRVVNLANEWLNLERQRPADFSVVERESEYQGQWAGIRFSYVIDRVDLTERGESVIVDYKTGTVSRHEWQGDRPKEPQLPLYALARDQLKKTEVSGIAFGQVRRGATRFFELAESGIFPASASEAKKRADSWAENRARWPEVFTRLAQEFLNGSAQVDPIDTQVCQYCELSTVCRIEELSSRDSERLISGSLEEGE